MPKMTWLLAVALATATHGAAAADGKTVYSQTCAACHASGLAGAPKLTDKPNWTPRIAGGKAALAASVIKGKGAMPPKAGNPSLSEGDIAAAIDYMVSQVSAAGP